MLEEKVRCEKIEVDSLKAKSAEMLASGQQNHAATQAQEILNKFDDIAEKIKVFTNNVCSIQVPQKNVSSFYCSIFI